MWVLDVCSAPPPSAAFLLDPIQIREVFFFVFFFKRLLFRLSDLKLCIKEGFTAAADYIINPYCLTPHLSIISKNDLVESAAGRSQSSSCLPLLAFFIEGVLVL